MRHLEKLPYFVPDWDRIGQILGRAVFLLQAVFKRAVMGQPGFFDFSDRLNSLSRLGDNLEALNEVVDWVSTPKIPSESDSPRLGGL